MCELGLCDTLCLQNQIQNNSGVRRNGLVKREMGVSPIRTRRCNNGASFHMSLGIPGRRNEVWMFKSEDLPVSVL